MKRLAPTVLLAALLASALARAAPSAGGSVQGSERPAPAALSTDTVVVAAVGDIACDRPANAWAGACQYDDVSDTVAAMQPDAFLPLGDVQYEVGALPDFSTYYQPYFGRFSGITYPVPGNHEYQTSSTADGYFSYFGAAAHSPGGYYSFDLGAWHVIALNSQLCYRTGCGPGTPQYQWLQQDLVEHPNTQYPCTLAYFHHPRFTTTGTAGAVKPFWELLVPAGADLVLNAHAHRYERWRPENADGTSQATGAREIVVGTGGRSLFQLGNVQPATFVKGQDRSFGALRVTLAPGSFATRWVSAAGQPSFKDVQRNVACV